MTEVNLVQATGEKITLFNVFPLQRNHKSCFGFAFRWIMEGNLHALNKEDLINIIKQKTASNQTLMNERKWIEEDNHLHRVQAVEFKEKLLKWQTHANEKDQFQKQMENESSRLKEEEKKLRADLSQAVEDFKTIKTKYHKLKFHYTALLKKYNTAK